MSSSGRSIASKRAVGRRTCLALVLGATAYAAAGAGNAEHRGHSGAPLEAAVTQRAATGNAPADAAPQSDISYLPIWLYALAVAPYAVFVYIIRKKGPRQTRRRD